MSTFTLSCLISWWKPYLWLSVSVYYFFAKTFPLLGALMVRTRTGMARWECLVSLWCPKCHLLHTWAGARASSCHSYGTSMCIHRLVSPVHGRWFTGAQSRGCSPVGHLNAVWLCILKDHLAFEFCLPLWLSGWVSYIWVAEPQRDAPCLASQILLVFAIFGDSHLYSSTKPAPTYHSHEKNANSRKFNRTSTIIFLKVTCLEVPLPLLQSLASLILSCKYTTCSWNSLYKTTSSQVSVTWLWFRLWE